ncbi:hypothetical protein [Dyadobacter jiangsuensis]|uniref:Lipocalin-like protein n=1 Tax=Dyadobacter jiangsuensis TaxID=1591085 RepID=A0A2P8FZT0_9BACT|nr:hypothetical protein [Dyadobacter jiangsuensis]PSL27222.1 hypothetical protein CLV60_10876 [Dyadobacter jiangsuensis]
MKKLVFYALVTVCGLLNVSAGCSEKKATTPEPDNSALLGYWKLKEGHSEWLKRNTEDQWVKKATINPGVIAYEFLPDKSFISYDLTGKLPAVKGTWRMEIKSLDGKNIELATLFLFSDTFKDIADTGVLEKDGSMRFVISMSASAGVEYLNMTSPQASIDEGMYSGLRNYMSFTKGK